MKGYFMKKLFLFLFSLLLIGCSKNNNGGQSQELDYSIVKTHIEWADIFNQQEVDYFVYFYSTTCAHCRNIKQQVLTYYLSEKSYLYFICMDKIDDRYKQPYDIIGICDSNKLYIFGTPFLIEVKNYKVYQYYAGEKSILEFVTK